MQLSCQLLNINHTVANFFMYDLHAEEGVLPDLEESVLSSVGCFGCLKRSHTLYLYIRGTK